MGVLHGLLVAGAIGLIAVAPCLVCLLLIAADEIIDGCWRAVRRTARRVILLHPVRADEEQRPSRLIRRWQDSELARRWQLSRLGAKVQAVAAPKPPPPTCPPIEQVAGDLRRLNRLRVGVALRSPVWFNAVQRAYDDGLRTACAQLGVEQHLDEVVGVDHELERLRVEGELQRAGLALRDAGAQQR